MLKFEQVLFDSSIKYSMYFPKVKDIKKSRDDYLMIRNFLGRVSDVFTIQKLFSSFVLLRELW